MRYVGIKGTSKRAKELERRNRKIMELRRNGVTTKAISARFGISVSQVCEILRRGGIKNNN